jgi:[acyl-carrier-protein] S-malonyltransferase
LATSAALVNGGGPFSGKPSRVAYSFRGYNVTNLGRTRELCQVPRYRSILESWLATGDAVCQEIYGGKTDLMARVERGEEADLAHYAEAVALIMAVELAQIEILREVHHVSLPGASFAFGYSLGELTAVAASGMIKAEEVMRVPVALAADCAALAENVSLGILFSRDLVLPEGLISRLCDEISATGGELIGVSAILSPNTLLVLGEGGSLERLRERVKAEGLKSIALKRDPHAWPPLHTPIVRRRHIPDRASVLMESMRQLPGSPPVFSLVTGSLAYETLPAREILRRWVDHPQRLWDAVLHSLKSDVQWMVHVGPDPNLIPATFHRVSENVRQQLARLSLSGLRMRAYSGLAQRRWLANLLPTSAALLRAPALQHVILEDWLLEHAPR